MMRITLALGLLAGAAGLAVAGLVTITFEDVTVAGPIGESYADLGLHFDANWQLLEGATATYPTHSGDKFVYTSDNTTFSAIDFDDPASRVSAWFTNGHSTALYFRAYDGPGGTGLCSARRACFRTPEPPRSSRWRRRGS